MTEETKNEIFYLSSFESESLSIYSIYILMQIFFVLAEKKKENALVIQVLFNCVTQVGWSVIQVKRFSC